MPALRQIATEVEDLFGISCFFQCEQPVLINGVSAATHLYHIAQEAVNNALKHAAAAEIRIGLEHRDGAVVLEVEDDGEGFEESQLPNDGIGLRVMRYLARLIDGRLEIGSAPAGGTRISGLVQMPA